MWRPAVSPNRSHWFDGTTWRPRSLPTRSGSRTAIITVVAILSGVALMSGSLILYAFASGEAHDAFGLNDTSIRDAAAAGCLGLTQALSDTTGDRPVRIAHGNVAIAELIAGMEVLGPQTLRDDKPALDWINDWQRLINARTTFANGITTGDIAEGEVFVVPLTDDGFPITERTSDVAPVECERAVELAPEP